MNKLFQFATVRVMGFAVAMMCVGTGLTSCSDDDDDAAPGGAAFNQEAVSKMSNLLRPARVGNAYLTYYLTYDENGLLVQAGEGSWDAYSFDWATKTYRHNNRTYSFTTNAAGCITLITMTDNGNTESTSFSYSADGHLQSAYSKYTDVDGGERYSGTDAYTYTWNNGNLVRVYDKWIEDGEAEEFFTTFAYDGQRKPLLQWTVAEADKLHDFMSEYITQMSGLFGLPSVCFPTSMTDEDGDRTSCTYSLNSDGSISSERSDGTYSYSYATRAAFEPVPSQGEKPQNRRAVRRARRLQRLTK